MRRGKETVLYHKGVRKIAKANDIDFIDLYNISKEKTLEIDSAEGEEDERESGENESVERWSYERWNVYGRNPE